MSIQFKNRDHERFYQQCLVRCGCGDPYHKAFFYTMGISNETRKHVDDVFDFQEDVIRPEGLNKGWQTSGSSCITRLAFNLWNGWNADGCATPYDLFSTSDAGYMLEAIRIRYPEYCREAHDVCGAERLLVLMNSNQKQKENNSEEGALKQYN